MMKNKKRYLYLDCEEARLVLQSLIRFKNKLLQQGRYSRLLNKMPSFRAASYYIRISFVFVPFYFANIHINSI